jgi:hypothetical protein
MLPVAVVVVAPIAITALATTAFSIAETATMTSLVATIATATSAKTRIKAWVQARVVSHATSTPTVASKPSFVASSLRRHWLAHVNYLGKGMPMFFGGRWRLVRGDTTAASG